MALPLKIVNRLRLGGPVAARIAGGRVSPGDVNGPLPGRDPAADRSNLPPNTPCPIPNAWVYVEPVVWAQRGLEQLLEGWTEMQRAGGAGEAAGRTYHVRYIELTSWHLEHPAGLGAALRERPVRDERFEVRGDTELARVLEQWLTDLSELRPPAEGGYPNPPYRY